MLQNLGAWIHGWPLRRCAALMLLALVAGFSCGATCAANSMQGTGVTLPPTPGSNDQVTGPAPSGQTAATPSAAGQFTFSEPLEPGFNLSSNALNATLDVIAAFGNQDAPVSGVTGNIVSVWKWNAVQGRWAFFSPQLTELIVVVKFYSPQICQTPLSTYSRVVLLTLLN